MFLRKALVLVVTGAGLGLLASFGLTRLMVSQLFGVRPMDPLTHLAVTLILIGSAGLAGYLSSRRAAALDPIVVLRQE